MTPERSSDIEHLRSILLGGGMSPECIPPADALQAHVDQARAYVEAGGMGWSVFGRAAATIKRAYEGPGRSL